MTWNLLHLARMLKDAGGIPAHGNQRAGWDAGCRFDFENPEHRYRRSAAVRRGVGRPLGALGTRRPPPDRRRRLDRLVPP